MRGAHFASSLVATAILLLPQPLSAQGTALFEEKSVQYSGGDYDDETFRYLLLKPDAIEEGKRYPVVLFLHGAGERGEDNKIQMAHFPVLFQDAAFRKRFPCFLIAPQCRVDRRWTETS
jgi:predicted peptidase